MGKKLWNAEKVCFSMPLGSNDQRGVAAIQGVGLKHPGSWLEFHTNHPNQISLPQEVFFLRQAADDTDLVAVMCGGETGVKVRRVVIYWKSMEEC